MAQPEYLTIPFDKKLIDEAYEFAKVKAFKGGRTEYVQRAVLAAVEKDRLLIKGIDPDQMEMEV